MTSSLKYDAKIASQSSYAEIQALNPQKIVLLGCAEVDEDAIVLNDEEEADKNFLKEFVFTEEDD